jgi:hypothetical protein
MRTFCWQLGAATLLVNRVRISGSLLRNSDTFESLCRQARPASGADLAHAFLFRDSTLVGKPIKRTCSHKRRIRINCPQSRILRQLRLSRPISNANNLGPLIRERNCFQATQAIPPRRRTKYATTTKKNNRIAAGAGQMHALPSAADTRDTGHGNHQAGESTITGCCAPLR